MSLEALAANGAIQLASRSVQTIRKAEQSASPLKAGNSSLTDVAGSAIVEPLVLVDASVATLDSASDLMQSVLTLWAGFYMQALSLQGTIGGIAAAERLGRFNPNRKPVFESLEDGAPPARRRLSGVCSLALEDAFGSVVNEIRNADIKMKQGDRQQDGSKKQPSMSVSDKAFDALKENVNLSVGRMFNVEFCEGDKSIRLPVAIRLLVNTMTGEQMRNFFTFRTTFDLDLKERWHGYKAGRLSMWRDLILCNDLIDKYRRAAISDKSGMTAEQLRRESNQISSSLTSPDKVSLATASNVVVMSSETLAAVENELGGSLRSPNIRKSVFDNTNLMFLMVVDSYRDIVTIWHRGLSMPTTLTMRDVKNNSKNGGPDVSDIMRTFLLGNAPLGR